MKSKTSRHGLKRMTALLLAVVLCIGMMPSAFAAQQDSYHDPAEHWQEANNRTNELDANASPAASAARPHPLRCSGRLSTLGTARLP